jgi:hypothetical protein
VPSVGLHQGHRRVVGPVLLEVRIHTPHEQPFARQHAIESRPAAIFEHEALSWVEVRAADATMRPKVLVYGGRTIPAVEAITSCTSVQPCCNL